MNASDQTRTSESSEPDLRRFLGEGTVKTHISHIFTRLDLRDRAAAVIFAFDPGLARPGDPRQPPR